jgi:hypothetical protein
VPVQGGWCSLRDDAWLGGLMAHVWAAGGIVALEFIEGGLYALKRWRQLLETGRVEGEVRHLARSLGAEPVMLSFPEMRARWGADRAKRTLYCVPASSWRAHLLQRERPKDAEIEVVVLYLCGIDRDLGPKLGRRRVIDLPGITSEAHEHVVDALGGALAMASVFLGAALRIPPEVRAQQAAAREKAMRTKAVQRVIDQLELDPSRVTLADGTPFQERRKPTRAEKAERRAKSATTRARRAK